MCLNLLLLLLLQLLVRCGAVTAMAEGLQTASATEQRPTDKTYSYPEAIEELESMNRELRDMMDTMLKTRGNIGLTRFICDNVIIRGGGGGERNMCVSGCISKKKKKIGRSLKNKNQKFYFFIFPDFNKKHNRSMPCLPKVCNEKGPFC